MLLLDAFYTIENRQLTDDQLEFTIAIRADHAIFSGHFPGNPVTPGVVQMELIKELIGSYLERPVQLQSMSNCKFLNILNPIETPQVQVRIQLKEEEGNWKANASIGTAETGFLKLSAVYA